MEYPQNFSLQRSHLYLTTKAGSGSSVLSRHGFARCLERRRGQPVCVRREQRRCRSNPV